MIMIFSKVLVIFIYIFIGIGANRLKVLPEESLKYFISLVMMITLPCLVVSSITEQEINGSMYRNTIITLVVTALLYVVIMAATTFISDRYFKEKEQQDRNVLASAMTGCNTAFMGFPIANAVFGEMIFYYISTWLIPRDT